MFAPNYKTLEENYSGMIKVQVFFENTQEIFLCHAIFRTKHT